jgi:branched-chain amino acid transport system substrate-binding protein
VIQLRRRAFLAATAASLAMPHIARAADNIKVAAPCELSGAYVAFGEAAQRGAKMALEVFKGKLAGQPADLMWRDTRSDAQVTASVINQFLLQDRANFMIFPVSSQSVASAIPAWRQTQPIWMISGATSVIEEQIGMEPHMFHTYPYTYDYQRSLAAAFKANLPAGSTISVMYADDAYGRSSLPSTRKYFGEAGFKILNEELIRAGATDLNPILTKIRVARPDALVVLAQAADFINIAKQIHVARLPVGYLAAGGDVSSAEWQNAVGEAQDGWIGIAPYVLGLGRPGDPNYPDLFPSQDDWEARFRAKYNREPSWNDAQTYTGSAMLFLAIDQAGDDQEKVHASLRAFDLKTVMGRGKFATSSTGGTLNQAFEEVVIFQRQSGKNLAFYPPDVMNGKLMRRNVG